MNDGYVIFGDERKYLKGTMQNYKGPARYICWPLDEWQNDEAIKLTEEANYKWFYFTEKAIWTVPDITYIERYIKACKNLCRINLYYYDVYFANGIKDGDEETVFGAELENYKFIGYDCLESTDESYLLDDNPYLEFMKDLNDVGIRFNDFGLFNSIEDACEYFKFRNNLLHIGVNIEKTSYERIAGIYVFMGKLRRTAWEASERTSCG